MQPSQAQGQNVGANAQFQLPTDTQTSKEETAKLGAIAVAHAGENTLPKLPRLWSMRDSLERGIYFIKAINTQHVERTLQKNKRSVDIVDSTGMLVTQKRNKSQVNATKPKALTSKQIKGISRALESVERSFR